jgi:hypothetical protein
MSLVRQLAWLGTQTPSLLASVGWFAIEGYSQLWDLSANDWWSQHVDLAICLLGVYF